ncbi:hypothetical protein [Ktedonospora formicarum]|uniref:Uncharacterized protein n=1 Tax=Ktedonospora formicarum TaxID=2778364 RepID=A0A8J3MS09_9CHLR|nr:hypothetical protein [Ktedonospora formicarum]GHO44366.1 hypothetical protein KSX_25290 [Ktedonospora formicarum]
MHWTSSDTVAILEAPSAQDLSMTQEPASQNMAYATAPIEIVKPKQVVAKPSTTEKASEEELHSSFEDALEQRLNSGDLRCISEMLEELPLTTTTRRLPHTEPLVLESDSKQKESHTIAQLSWKSYVLIASFALICILLGFDMMGLLLLSSR